LKPAPPNTGVLFQRVDIPNSTPTRAILANVTDGKLATTIGENGTGVNTVEHLLGALAGLGIDNALIELDAAEIPILDGSAAPFVKIFRTARCKFQNELKKFVMIKEPIVVRSEDKYIEVYPADRTTIEFTIEYDHPLIKTQQYSFCFGYSSFVKEISGARTFCFLEDVERLRANGYALGGSLQNAVVIDKHGILNPDGLRFPDEFVRHKVLDLIGDLSLLGHPIIGHIRAFKSGHFLNHQFLRKVLSEHDKWELTKIVPLKNKFIFQKSYHSPFIPLQL
jgi:UDP-3-O-[3-hydroxymyristoyl] N-acetylglucosamine deacetylase